MVMPDDDGQPLQRHAYAAQDDSDAVMDAWSNHIRSYEKKVKGWTNKSKGLKEFSRVK